MHAKVPTKYCVKVRAFRDHRLLSTMTYGIGRYCSAILRVDIDKTGVKTVDNQVRTPLPIFPKLNELGGEKRQKDTRVAAALP
jgi:hypothetical protein